MACLASGRWKSRQTNSSLGLAPKKPRPVPVSGIQRESG